MAQLKRNRSTPEEIELGGAFLRSEVARSVRRMLPEERCPALRVLRFADHGKYRVVSTFERMNATVMMAAAVAIFFLFMIPTWQTGRPPLAFTEYLIPAAPSILIGSAILVSIAVGRRRRMGDIPLAASYRLVKLSILTNQLHGCCVMEDKDLKRALRQLEACAKLFDRLPYAYPLKRDETALRDLSATGLGIAEQFRQYKLWLAMPIESTAADITDRLAVSLIHLHDGPWYLLPKADLATNRRSNLIHRIAWSILFLLLVAGLVWIALNQASLGMSGQILTTIVAIAIVFVLSRLGVEIAQLQQVAAASSQLEQKVKVQPSGSTENQDIEQ